MDHHRLIGPSVKVERKQTCLQLQIPGLAGKRLAEKYGLDTSICLRMVCQYSISKNFHHLKVKTPLTPFPSQPPRWMMMRGPGEKLPVGLAPQEGWQSSCGPNISDLSASRVKSESL